MRDTRKEIFFPLFALFVIFSDEFFYSLTYIFDIPLESGMKAREAISIATISYFMMIVDIFKGRITRRNWFQFTALFVLLVLYVITGYWYPHNTLYHNYTAALLVYGALCIPACYVGMRLARGGYEDSMMRYLPYFLIAVALIVGYAVFSGFSEGRLLGYEEDKDVGLNYQNASYYMSYCSAFCLFYVFLNDKKKKGWHKIVYYIIVLLIFLCTMGTIVGGGRGAFVYLILISAFLLYRIFKRSFMRKGGRYIIMLIGLVAVFSYLAAHYNIFESIGALRVSQSLTIDDARIELTRKALDSFGTSPILGHGLGSVWWEVGFYSHNMFMDFLVESGIIGTVIFSIVIITLLYRLIRSSRLSNFDLFLFLILISHLVQDSFSGYWFSSFCLFLIYGYVYGKQFNFSDRRLGREV